MRRVWAGIGQAVESAAIAAVGLVVCALVMLAVWGIDQGFGGDPVLQWRLAADAWLIGHGVDIGVTLGRDAVIAVGLEEAGRSFVLSLGAWGIGLITLWLHWRSGRRLATLPLVDVGVAVLLGTAATAAIGLLVGTSAQHGTAAPDLVHAALLPALVALVGMLAAVIAVRGHDWLVAAARSLTIDHQWLRATRAALRTGFAGAVGVLGVGALLVAAGLFLRFTDALLLLESLGVTPVGVVVVFLLQLALAPVAIVWAASWAIGPGFMVGLGSSVSPLGTDLGPVPALPLLAAIDPSAQPWMAVVVVLPVLAAVLVGVLARQSVLAGTERRPVHWWELAIAATGGGVLAGALLGIAAMLSTGAAGPGRLAITGPDAVLVAAWGALEVGVGLLIGMIAGGRGTGALAGGFALPLATEREGSRIRDALGLGRSEAAEEPAAEPSAEWSDDAPADARVDAPVDGPPDAPVDAPADAPPDAPPDGEQHPAQPAAETSPVVSVSTEDRASTQAVEPVDADDADDAAAEGDRAPR
ncbi:cell division protein PerM [Agrococcus baldri]|uniref:cell division protein PerM n=1 Tax=Agrococcus baldri TaxID=153730 RepID=UPI0011BF4015|nr:DUF6350 family protein [Agrococcus baldri]